MGRAPAARPIRVVHLPAAVGGHAPSLARAERELGLDSKAIVFDEPSGLYDIEDVLFPPGLGRLRREGRRWRLLLDLLRSTDVVHFNFGRPLSPLHYPRSVTGARGAAAAAWAFYTRLVELRELPLLKRTGRALFVTYQGDDVRTRAIAPHFPAGYYDPGLDRRKSEWVRRFDRHVDGVFALNPDLLRVLPPRAEFLPYANVRPADWQPVPPRTEGTVTVLHAPSHRGVKGTPHVVAAVELLRSEGIDVELLLVEGKAHAEAREAYERSDLLVDQLLAGWYGGLAVELMALGKPVIAHLRREDLAPLPTAMRDELPVIDATPATLAAVLRELLVERRAELPELGLRGRAYVERWHDPLEIAARLKRDYERALGRRSGNP